MTTITVISLVVLAIAILFGKLKSDYRPVGGSVLGQFVVRLVLFPVVFFSVGFVLMAVGAIITWIGAFFAAPVLHVFGLTLYSHKF